MTDPDDSYPFKDRIEDALNRLIRKAETPDDKRVLGGLMVAYGQELLRVNTLSEEAQP